MIAQGQRSRLTIPGINAQVALFFLHSAIFHVGLMGIPDVLLNFYFVSLGYDTESIGLLQSLPRIGGLLTGLPVGMLAHRLGAKRIILVSAIGAALTFFMLILWPSLTMLGVSRFLFGFFYGAGQIATGPFIGGLTERRHHTHLFAYHNTVSMGASALGSLIGGYLPAIIAAWFAPLIIADSILPAETPFAYGAALVIAAVIVIVSVIPLLRLPEQYVSASHEPAPRVRNAPWLMLIWFGVPLLIFGISGGLTFPFYNLFFRTVFDQPDEAVGTILSIGWLGMALVPMLNPLWERYFGRSRALGITLTLAAAAFLALSIAPTLALALVAYTVAISTRNTMQPLYQPLVMDVLPPSLHHLVTSVCFVMWNIGWFMSTAISGYWQETYGFGFIMQVVAASLIVNAVSVLLVFRGRKSYRAEINTA